jgi:catechol 2,3-dioxygenase-like lactoylglutathione lyase family enzyme
VTIDLPGMYHVGLVVEDLDRAVESYGAQLNLTWAPLQHRELSVRHQGRIVGTDLRFTYSREGPVHLELIEAAPGSPWEASGSLHHVGFWSDDLIATARSLEAAGLVLDTTYDTPSPDPVGFGYFIGQSGLRLEVVDGARRSGFDDWLAGGDFPAAAGN